MKSLLCKCGDPVSRKAHDQALALNADTFRCQVCLDIWKEGVRRQPPKRNVSDKMPETSSNSKVTAAVVEQCAYEGLTVVRSATRCGVAVGTLMSYIYSTKNPLNLAWKAGKTRRKNDIASGVLLEVKS